MVSNKALIRALCGDFVIDVVWHLDCKVGIEGNEAFISRSGMDCVGCVTSGLCWDMV